jgi:hypothetical protein
LAQAKTAQSTIKGNVFFNGPRAGINANDGFGGGDEIAHNLVFSTCRESGDHGPFNSWDRQPFLTTVRTGEPSMQMQWREIHHNFFIDNYSPQEDVDSAPRPLPSRHPARGSPGAGYLTRAVASTPPSACVRRRRRRLGLLPHARQLPRVRR